MKTINLFIIIMSLCYGVSFTSLGSYHNSEGINFFKTIKSDVDISSVNKYAKKALSYGLKPEYISLIKAYIDTAEIICEKKKLELPSSLHLARAEYFFITGDFNNSSLESKIALKMSQDSKDNEVLVKTLNFLGQYSLRTELFKESLEYFNSAIALAKKNRLNGIIAKNYNGIADVYNALGNQKDYRNSMLMVIDAANKENDTMYTEAGTFMLGSSFTNNARDFRKADSLLRICLALSLIKKDTSYIALSSANLGWNFYLEKNYDSSLKFYNKSLDYSLPSKRYSFSANSYGNIGTIYRDLDDKEKSLKYYLKSIEQAKHVEDVYNLSWVYQDMSEMYLQRKDTANAYKTFVLFKKFSDSQILKSNSQGLSDARIRYEADSHNKEVELLSLRVRNQRLLIYGYTGLFVLSLAIGFLLFRYAKINAKRRISEMNRKIAEVSQANLRQQMNPHFIFNTLNSIQYYMYQHDKLATNNYLTKFSSLMRKILENSQHTSVPLRDELDALNLYLELEMIRFKDKFDYEIKVDEEIDTLLYKVPTMLIQPYVENSISHGLMPAEGKGLVKINLKLANEYISCTIEDNGIGREAAQDKKRKSENNHNSLGTQIVSSRLDLVNALYGTSLKTIYTDLKNIDGKPEGTMVEIQIPIIT